MHINQDYLSCLKTAINGFNYDPGGRFYFLSLARRSLLGKQRMRAVMFLNTHTDTDHRSCSDPCPEPWSTSKHQQQLLSHVISFSFYSPPVFLLHTLISHQEQTHLSVISDTPVFFSVLPPLLALWEVRGDASSLKWCDCSFSEPPFEAHTVIHTHAEVTRDQTYAGGWAGNEGAQMQTCKHWHTLLSVPLSAVEEAHSHAEGSVSHDQSAVCLCRWCVFECVYGRQGLLSGD